MLRFYVLICQQQNYNTLAATFQVVYLKIFNKVGEIIGQAQSN